jgi:hypothetical protein
MRLRAAETLLYLENYLVDEQDGAAKDHQSNCCQLEVGGEEEVVAAHWVVHRLATVQVVDHQDQDVDAVDGLASGVLDRVHEGLTMENVSNEAETDKQEDDTAVLPLVEQGDEQTQHEPVDECDGDVSGLQALGFELVEILPELLFVSDPLSDDHGDDEGEGDHHGQDRPGVHFIDVLHL